MGEVDEELLEEVLPLEEGRLGGGEGVLGGGGDGGGDGGEEEEEEEGGGNRSRHAPRLELSTPGSPLYRHLSLAQALGSTLPVSYTVIL